MNKDKGIQSLIEAAQRIADLRAKSKDRTQQMADLATEARTTGKSQSHRLSQIPHGCRGLEKALIRPATATNSTDRIDGATINGHDRRICIASIPMVAIRKKRRRVNREPDQH